MRIRTAMPFLAVLGVLLSGCSGDSGDDPTTLPSLSATPSASTSPDPVPEVAKAKTPQGADAFVRFFFKQLNVAFSTSDSSLIATYVNGECELCQTYESGLDSARKSGQVLVGDSFVVTEVAAPPLAKLGTVVEVFGTIPARELRTTKGELIKRLPADGPFHFQVAVKTRPDGWIVSGIRLA